MDDVALPHLLWWLGAVEAPAFGGLFWLIWRVRREAETRLAGLAARLADDRLEAARTYVSWPALKDVESRLTAHLLRIETKLDRHVEALAGGRDA